jgi:tRNA-splicing ligase RtcB
MKVIDGIPVWGDPVDEGALAQIKLSAQGASRAAMMADHHKGYAVPIGGVLAYENAVSPSGVGYDIGCGNKAVRLEGVPIYWKIQDMMDVIYSNLSFGVGRVNERAPDHALFDDPAWTILPQLKEMARQQLGTIGSGNHYVDIFVDEDSHVWIGVHFGSRGLGHKTATHFLKAGGAKDGMDVAPLVLPLGTPIGDDYMEAMRLAGAYAYAGRDWVCEEVARLLGAEIVEEVHNHHNFAWRERHGDMDYIVVRKGATPAFPGQKGFIGGSMGENAVIVEGVEHPDHVPGLYSTVHGAGRVMSRTAARGKWDRKTGEVLSPGLISKVDMQAWLEKEGVELRGADVDEAPQAYKRLPEVLAHHEGTIRILHTLKPLGVAMAGARTVDPFKD